jgi:excisionase family DNA binding protein
MAAELPTIEDIRSLIAEHAGAIAEAARPEWMTKSQLANYLQVSAWTVDKAIADGIIPETRLSRKTVRFNRHAVDRALTKIRRENAIEQIT